MFKWTLILVCLQLNSVFGQVSLGKRDSVEIAKISESFFNWYADLIRTKKIRNFNPQFVKTADGMTSLDFSSYSEGLKQHQFTADLITNRIKRFQDCLDNLNSIPFNTFQQFEDLDQFEEINCAFSNGYEFIGGMMDPIDGADMTRIKLLNKNTAIATVTLYYMTGDKKNSVGQMAITLTKVKRDWKISDI